MDTLEKCLDLVTDLQKAKKKGEGSRGGKIIGHTKSGKPIYGPASNVQKHHARYWEDPRGTKHIRDHVHRDNGDLLHEAVQRHVSSYSSGWSKKDHDDARRLHQKMSDAAKTKYYKHYDDGDKRVAHIHRGYEFAHASAHAEATVRELGGNVVGLTKKK